MKRRLFKGLTVLGLAGALCLPFSSGNAYIPSLKGLGMGGTGVAYPQDAESGAHNPAGAAWVGNRINGGLTITRSDGDTELNIRLQPAPGISFPVQVGTFQANSKHYVYNPHLGVTNDFWCCGDQKLTASLVLYNHGEAFSKYTVPVSILGQTPPSFSFIQEVLSPMIAYKWNDRHSIGISMDLYFQRLNIYGLENFSGVKPDILIPFSSDPSAVTNNGPSFAQGVNFTVGYLGEIYPGVKFGFAYSPQGRITHFKEYAGFVAQHGRLDTPQRIAAGITLQLTKCVAWTLDVVNQRFGAIHALANPLTEVEGPDNQLGTANGAAFNWGDRTFYRTGIDWRVNKDLWLRAGFRHANLPYPAGDEGSVANILTMETIGNFVTAGLTYRFMEQFEFNFYYAHGFRASVECPVPAFITEGVPGLVADPVRFSQSKEAFGFGLGWCY